MNRIVVRTSGQNRPRLHTFYDKLGWQSLNNDGSYRYDGQVIIELAGQNDARTSILMYSDDKDKIAKKLIDLGRNIIQTEASFICVDPNGVRWEIGDSDAFPDVHFNRDFERSLLGKYFGLGIESIEFEKSAKFYQALGYSIRSGEIEKKSYLTMSQDGCQDITIFYPGTCPHSFYNPSLTFFNGKEGNPKLISAMRTKDIVFTEEITVFSEDNSIDNVIVEDGGGLHFFVFND